MGAGEVASINLFGVFHGPNIQHDTAVETAARRVPVMKGGGPWGMLGQVKLARNPLLVECPYPGVGSLE
jgi:hypothetical protein